MDVAVIVFAVITVLSKIVDVWSTIKYVGTRAETNPFARPLFRIVGCTAGSWIIFAFEAVIVTLVTWEVLSMDWIVSQIGLIVMCAIVTYAQISAGIFNATGQQTFLIKLMLWLYGKINSRIHR